jgi:hypothetical protein
VEIDLTRIPTDKSPEEIENFILNEIKSGKLMQWKIAKIKMQPPIKENEFPELIYLSEYSAYPKLFTILKNSSQKNKYTLSISIQSNY